MTEQEWMECTEPGQMLYFLRDRASDRKLRLFACACCRLVWNLLTDPRSRHAIEIAERFADTLVTSEEMLAAQVPAREAIWRLDSREARNAARAALDTTVHHGPDYPGLWSNAWHAANNANNVLTRNAELKRDHVALLRCLFGNPFRSMTIDPAWRTWNGGMILKMAQSLYNERNLHALPILADALEEAGCTDADILSHCRGPGPHTLGCWVVDLLLDKH